MTSQQDREKKKKRQKNELEAYIFMVLQKSMQEALRQAIDDIFKDWK